MRRGARVRLALTASRSSRATAISCISSCRAPSTTATDEYNGDLRARARILLEVLAAVRAAVGRDFFVSMKLSGRDAHNASAGFFNRTLGNTIDDTMKVSRWLADAGLDAIHLSQGDSFPHPLIPAGLLPADDVRRALAGMFYEGRRAQRSLLLLQFSLFRRFSEWSWGRRMSFKRRGKLLPEKIEGMNQDDAAKVKAASGLPVICVGGWQTASRIREALVGGSLRRRLDRAWTAGEPRYGAPIR